MVVIGTALKIVRGIPQPRPFVIPAWLEHLQLIKLVFRPCNFGMAFMRDGASIREFYVTDEHYYFTIGWERARNVRAGGGGHSLL